MGGVRFPLADIKAAYFYDSKSDWMTGISFKKGNKLQISQHFTYDEGGNRLVTTQKEPDKQDYIQNYSYNKINQLISRTYGSETTKTTHSYTFDKSGNLRWFTHSFGTQTATYKKDSDQVDKTWKGRFGDAFWREFSYDANGNRTGFVSKDYSSILFTWDCKDPQLCTS